MSEATPPPTERHHETSWSADLEGPQYADDPDLVVEHARIAIERTADDVHVNLVTHGAHGHPEGYLYPALSEDPGEAIDVEFVDRCGCGGYVTRVRRTG